MSPEPEPWPTPGRVLLVEDDVLLRFLPAEKLREAGLGVIEAANADEAFSYIQTAYSDRSPDRFIIHRRADAQHWCVVSVPGISWIQTLHVAAQRGFEFLKFRNVRPAPGRG